MNHQGRTVVLVDLDEFCGALLVALDITLRSDGRQPSTQMAEIPLGLPSKLTILILSLKADDSGDAADQIARVRA
jgi:hypothetical protein